MGVAAYLKKDKQNSADVRVSKHSKESMRLLMTIPLKRCRRRRNAGAIMKIPNMVGNDASQSTVRNKNPYNLKRTPTVKLPRNKHLANTA